MPDLIVSGYLASADNACVLPRYRGASYFSVDPVCRAAPNVLVAVQQLHGGSQRHVGQLNRRYRKLRDLRRCEHHVHTRHNLAQRLHKVVDRSAWE